MWTRQCEPKWGWWGWGGAGMACSECAARSVWVAWEWEGEAACEQKEAMSRENVWSVSARQAAQNVSPFYCSARSTARQEGSTPPGVKGQSPTEDGARCKDKTQCPVSGRVI